MTVLEQARQVERKILNAARWDRAVAIRVAVPVSIGFQWRIVVDVVTREPKEKQGRKHARIGHGEQAKEHATQERLDSLRAFYSACERSGAKVSPFDADACYPVIQGTDGPIVRLV